MAHSANGTGVQIEPLNLREHVDGNGVLRDGAMDAPAPSTALTVFSQRADAGIELAAWKRHAEDFFGARLGFDPAHEV